MLGKVLVAIAATGLMLLSVPGAQAADLLHNSNDTGSYNAKWPNGWGIAGGKYGEFTCATCHEPNNRANLKNIRTVINSENGDLLPNGQTSVSVTFRNQTSMGDDTQAHASSNRICEVCHSKNQFHNFNTANNAAMGHPNPKEVCVTCHKHNTGFKAACGGCHGNPPTTAALGGNTGLIGTPRPSFALMSGQAGAHDKHVNGRSLICDTCHYISNGGFKMPTQSGSIQIGFFGFGGKVTSGTYVPFTSAKRGYRFASGTPNTTIAGAVTDPLAANKCTNLYCHGGGAPGKAPLSGGANQTPKWDGSGQSACGNCHGASAANPPTMGSHQKHAGSASGYSLTCDTCHPATDISHVQGNVRWQFSASDPRVAGAQYQAAGSASAVNAGSTGGMAPSAAYGQCSNLYCHSNGRGGAANVATPTWGNTAGFTGCVGCHGGAAASATPITSNAHKAHTNNTQAPFSGVRFSCAECHSQVVNGTNTTIIGSSLHVNSSKNVDWGTLNSGSPSYGTSGCSQIYCHSNGRGAFTPPASTWTAVADGTQGTAGCDYCHRGRVADQKPMSSARHTNHITQSPVGGVRHKAVTCDVCHDNTVAPGGTTLIAGGSHLNKNRDVNFAKFANRSGSYNAGAKQCSNTYCHASTTMTWTSTTVNQCGDCHAANNTTTQGLSSPHIKHYNTTTMPTNANGWTNANNSSTTTASNVFMCGTCHAVNPETDHINGPATLDGDAAQVVLSLPFTPPAGAARPNTVTLGAGQNADGKGYFYSAGTTCDVYCHSDARGGLPKTTMLWSTTTSSCGNCHNKAGDANPTWSQPHTKHVNTYNGNTNITCNSCHAVTASANNTLLARRDRHPNGFRNVTSNTAAGPFSWDGDRCNNTYCHYGTSPSWSTGSGTLPADCTGCHGNDASSSRPMNKNAHKAHVNNQSARFNGFNFKCNECHNSTVAADNRTIASYTVHANGSKTVVWGTLSNGGGAYSAGACATIYCHSNGQATPTYKAPANWTTVADGTEGTANCDYCHGGQTTDTTPISSNRHTNHITTSPASGIRHRGVTCDTCHDNTAAPGGTTILASGGTHLNRAIDINFAKFSNRSGSYAPSNKQCSVTYCHGRNNPRWTTTTINNCGSCHYADNTANGLSGPHAKHYNSATRPTTTNGWNNTNSSTKTNHVFYCGVCHAVNPEADHVNGPVTQNGAAAQIVFNIPKVPSGITRPNTFTYGTTQNQDLGGYFYSTGTTCDVYCHSDGRGGPSKTQFNWTSTKFHCGECHNSANDGDPSPTWSAPHTKHVRTYYEGGNTNLGCYSCHKSTVFAQNTSIADKSKHINGYRNISSSSFANFTWNGTTCSTGYCHSDGKATPNYVSQTWTSLSNGCYSCHGGAGVNNPNGQALTNAHAKHLNTATYNFKCASCHAKTADPASNTALKNYTGVKYHVNATRNVILLPTYGGTYTSSTCSTVYCHSNGQTTPTYNSPNWTSTTSTCTTCHGGDSGQASIMASNRHGSHMNNAVNLGTNFACSTCHASTIVNGSNTAIADYSKHLNKNRDVAFGLYSGTSSGASPAITCSNTRCHANRNPLWTAAATTDHKCTKCHGAVGVTNPTPAQMAPGNGRDLDGSDTMTSPTKDIQVGAHQQHLGGTGSMNIATVRCIECHTVPATATANNHLGRRAAEVTFTNATSARKNGAAPAWTASSGSVAGKCSNVYCHGAAMPKGDTSGTYRMAGSTTVFWNQTSLLVSRTPSPTVCGVCHGAPPTAGTTASTHASYVGQGLSVCNQCHSHVNTNGTIADVTKHINGSVEALTGCNACHDYDTVGATYAAGDWSGGSWGKSSKDGLTPNEGWGAHAKHINYIKGRLGITVALNPTSQTFGVGEPASICGSCHTNNVANHTTSGSTVRTINFGDSTFKIGGTTGTSFLFGTTNPVYNGASGTSSAITPKTCSNISCHYFTTPIWSTY